MKALIFNSGIGSRMGELTKNCPKCLLKLKDNETILSRQLRILAECGITDVIITTGKYEDEIAEECKKHKAINTIFVNNPLYESTNYIYSMYLAKKYLNDDILMIHGDLVFNNECIKAILSNQRSSVCLINKSISQPLKDFKGRLINDLLNEVSVNIYDDNCYALQPVYKLSKECIYNWLAEVSIFIEKGITDVYAENALNNILSINKIYALSYEKYYINEIDTFQDYERVSREIEISDKGGYFNILCLADILEKYKSTRPFAIIGKHLKNSKIEYFFDTLGVGKYFGAIENPTEESIIQAQRAFVEYGGDLLISIGGGSVIDTAKGIRFFLLNNEKYSSIPHISIPTTAGSGSESTHFAVIYKNGVKESLADKMLLPDNIILDSRLLYSMNEQQRKVSLLDALCHSIESILSINSTAESIDYAVCSLKLILGKYQEFINCEKEAYKEIMIAADYAGKAINISKTTIGHAMSYTLTSEYGIKHGQAVAICLINALKYIEQIYDLKNEFIILYNVLGIENGQSLSDRLSYIYNNMKLECNYDLSYAQADVLAKKVNAERLMNFIVPINEEQIKEIYSDIIRSKR